MTLSFRLAASALAAACLALAVDAYAQTASSAAGVWNVTVQSPQGPASATAVLADENGRLTGMLSGDRGQYPVEGTRTPDNITLRFTIRHDGSPLPITLTAKPGAEALDGAVDFGGQESGTWTAKRAPSGDVTGAWVFSAKDTSGTPRTGVLTLLDQNGAVTGRLVIRSRGVDGVVKGTRADGTLELVTDAQVDGSSMSISMPGTVGADGLNGTFSVEDVSGTWTAVRP